MRHTPGPWAVRTTPRAQADFSYREIMAGDAVLGEIYSGDVNEPTDDECEANARLIAAAPELLATLEATIRDPMIAQVGGSRILRAERILAKARGEQVSA